MVSLNKRISDLPDNTSLDGTELFELQKGTTTGSSQKLTLSVLAGKIKDLIAQYFGVQSVTASGTYVQIDNTDPNNPIVELSDELAAYDKSGTFQKPQVIPPLINNAVTGAIAPDFGAYSNFEYTITGNTTINNPTGAVTGQFINMVIMMGGAFTVTLGTSFKLLNTTTIKTDSGTVNILSGYVASNGNIYCNISQ